MTTTRRSSIIAIVAILLASALRWFGDVLCQFYR